ncbi:M23 family metallopeptidase [Ulvibacter antarcticus]|uniref:Murein DD-endopeptidase MepM/ murein hydrolase activator NlpD n=1 Tax=Ulvibacter antarcticus TaxID=442714 RepID=A0A3L9Z2Y8_9FLAO|nr:M23 family metallopeptidase [Ulvibacter antarcticus]RMA65789.1 murein DD-endopeptidase MepM/ murein hydrolase activator NlpD [Ulvibacter antarcticus]
MKVHSWIFFLLLSITYFSCDQIQNATDVVTKPDARDLYKRQFEKRDSSLLRWKKAYEYAKKDSLLITLPYSESGIFSNSIPTTYSYDVRLREDEQIVISIETEIDTALVFISLFQKTRNRGIPLKLLKISKEADSKLAHQVKNYAYYKIIVQPEISLNSPFTLKIYTAPVYSFPISGGENKDIRGFWADPRDAGARSHDGVDIFAPKGTPLVAATKGVISSSGDHGLGGKQVWLKDGVYGKTLYYAHLDSIFVAQGDRVKQGDTIGLVGNTGNAITTEPHLHFGIYEGKRKAVNPLPYIKKAAPEPIKTPNTISKGFITTNRANLRKGPAEVFPVYGSLKKNDTVIILGRHRDWFHIQFSDSLKGFIEPKFLSELPN